MIIILRRCVVLSRWRLLSITLLRLLSSISLLRGVSGVSGLSLFRRISTFEEICHPRHQSLICLYVYMVLAPISIIIVGLEVEVQLGCNCAFTDYYSYFGCFSFHS